MPGSIIQRSLAGGEIAQALGARADQTKYQTGLKRCRNFIVMRHGGATNRTGTKHINEVKNSSLATYFIKFVFNADQTYVIEVGNEYFRFFRNGARIVVSGVVAWSNVTAYVVGDLASRLGVNYYCIAAHTNQQPPNATYWYPLTGDIYEIPTPYLTAELPTLSFHQSGDVVTLLHPNWAPRELSRTAHTTWTLTASGFAPALSAPTNLAVTASGAGTVTWRYKVTAVQAETYEESLPSSAASDTGDAPTVTAPHALDWDDSAGAVEYNVYRETSPGSGTYGFIGVAGASSFSDDGIQPDGSITPPISRTPFSGADNRPSTGAYYQQRQVFANSNNDPEKVWTSRTGSFKNLTISSPLQDDDAVTFTIAGKEVQEVRHLIPMKRLLVLTAGGEWVIKGDANGVLLPTAINADQDGYNGASDVRPVVIGNSVIYVQARGNIVRDLRFEFTSEGYTGKDLTIFAPHLFAKRTITRMDFAQIPHSIAWFIRSDGVMLGLTYLREHEVWGWHWHDTDGTFEDVVVVPEGEEDAVYVIVKRTINGSTKRYVERLANYFNEETDDIDEDALFLDSYLTYNGWNTSLTRALTITSGSPWTVDTLQRIASSEADTFAAGDVGKAIDLIGSDGSTVRITITSFVNSFTVEGYPDKTVPATLRNTATLDWALAVTNVTGLGHLEAKEVSIFADGHVIANPNNPAYTVYTVSGGTLSAALDRPYAVIHVGLPITADLQTLDLDIAGEQVRDRKKKTTSVSLLVQSTRGIFVGESFPVDDDGEETDGIDDLDELQMEESIDDYGEPMPLQTGNVEIPINATWNKSGSFVLRQSDPLPATILGVMPNGDMGG